MCMSMVGMEGGARCQGFGLLGGQPGWACWGRGGTQERSGAEKGGLHRPTGLFSSWLPHPSHYEGPLCPLKASFFPGVQSAAPSTEGCHLWASGGHSFRREAGTAHGEKCWARAWGPRSASRRSAVPGTPFSLFPCERCSLAPQHVRPASQLWFGEV